MMDQLVLKKYYEDNINKGYTVEQITNNLLNNNYKQDELDSIISLLDVSFIELSKNNASKFDYSSLPEYVSKEIKPPSENIDVKDSNKIPSLNETDNKNKLSLKNKTISEEIEETIEESIEGIKEVFTSPQSLDKQDLIKYGSIVGTIFIIIIISILFFAFSGENPEDAINDYDSLNGAGSDFSDSGSDLNKESNVANLTKESDNNLDNNITDNYNENVQDYYKDCESNIGCVISRLEDCKETDAIFSSKMESQNMEFNIERELKIYQKNSVCIYEEKIDNVDVDFPKSTEEALLSSGLTQQELDAQKEQASVNFEKNIMKEFVCEFESSDEILPFFEKLKQGSYGGDIDCDNNSDNSNCEFGGSFSELKCYDPDNSSLENKTGPDNNSQDSGLIKPTIPQSSNKFIDTSDIICKNDLDCDDGNTLTYDWCGDDKKCRHSLSVKKTDCKSGDDYCPKECYGTDDDDCVDNMGRRLCTKNDHCDDEDNRTEDLCLEEKGYCDYYDIPNPNEAPIINSTPPTNITELENYTYLVEAYDPEEDNITFSLSSAPDGMTINESTGELNWIPPLGADSTGIFYVIASDGEDSSEQEIELEIFQKPENDELFVDCEGNRQCYKNALIIRQEHERCENLGVYWEDEDYFERDDCVLKIVQDNENTDLCVLIHDSSMKSVCENT